MKLIKISDFLIAVVSSHYFPSFQPAKLCQAQVVIFKLSFVFHFLSFILPFFPRFCPALCPPLPLLPLFPSHCLSGENPFSPARFPRLAFVYISSFLFYQSNYYYSLKFSSPFPTCDNLFPLFSSSPPPLSLSLSIYLLLLNSSSLLLHWVPRNFTLRGLSDKF